MSRSHSNRYSDYGGDYYADYDDPRDHRDSHYDADYDDPRDRRDNPRDRRDNPRDRRDRYHLSDPKEHGNKYKAGRGHQEDPRHQIVPSHPAHHHLDNFSRSYPFPVLPRHEQDHRLRLPPPDLEGSMEPKYWHTPGQISALQKENKQRAEDSRSFGRRAIEPAYHEQRQTKPKEKGFKARPTARSKKDWTADEDAELLRHVRDRKNYSYIAGELGRSPESCGSRWRNHVRDSWEARGVDYNPWP